MEPLAADDPRQIGPCRLLRRLGSGGMGRVYLGRNAGGRTVAVKVVHPHFAVDRQFRARFAREVAAARRVGGEWTAPVLDADPDAELPWVATGYVAGPDLQRTVAGQGPLPQRSLRVLGAGLAEALAAVHALGLVHRDIKPSNVLLTLDGPRLIDFGIARAMDTEATAELTATGMSVGSPGYMSPEQVVGRQVGAPSDVFQLGAVLAYAATGRRAFPGDNTAQLVYRVVHGEPDLAGVPQELRELIGRCLAKDEAARPVPAEIAAALAGPQGAAGLVAAGWLPSAVVEGLSRLAVELLDLEVAADPSAPPPAEPGGPGGPRTQAPPPTSGGTGPGPVPPLPAAQDGPERTTTGVPGTGAGTAPPRGVFGPPTSGYGYPGTVSAAMPTPSPSPAPSPYGTPPGGAGPATPPPDGRDGKGGGRRRATAAAAAALIPAIVLGCYLLGIPVDWRDTAGGDRPTPTPTSAGTEDSASTGTTGSTGPREQDALPESYVGTWTGEVEIMGGLPGGSVVITLEPGVVGEVLGTAEHTDMLAISTCTDRMTLETVAEDRITFAAEGDPDASDALEGVCAPGEFQMVLTPRDDGTVRFESLHPDATHQGLLTRQD
ncbi:serine/threonine-protein kinase [Streptomyces aidingensis]|uniref:Serine/threonine protein kinase n=1 Tax=Streptomyces aidingensis TaxID=910347 RepID=A0A1I1E0Q1_9ACTN|nr:serine/threonine-protein kinase [Streptomyces aidingensis]SFB80644.1 Serine/threonine protein kinase [Streptomyces aidingensis]